MLKGLEISEVRLSALERTWRLDAEFYSKVHLRIDNLLRANAAVPLTNFANVSDGNHMGISDEFCTEGIPYFRGGDIKEFFLSFARPEYCVPESIYVKPTMVRSHMKQGDVFVSIVGAIIGQIGMKTDDAPALCSCKLGILRPKSHQTSAYIAAFLSSGVGQSQIWRYRRGSAQTGLILDDFDQLLVPSFSDKFYLKIESLVSAALKARHGAVEAMKEAEQMLLDELGFSGWSPTDDAVSVKSYSDFVSAGRFDAEYFQPKYDDYFKMIARYRNGHKRLGDLTTQNTSQCDKTFSEYDYIEIGDVNVGNATYCSNRLSVGDLPANAKIMAHRGELIISKVRPNRGAVAIIEDERSDLVVSGAFTVVAPKDEILRECLLVLLRTTVYRDWLLRWAVGSSYPVVKDEDVLNVPIPLIDRDIQQKIADKVQSSFALRAESKRLLDLAKHAVEIAIKRGEERAIIAMKEISQ